MNCGGYKDLPQNFTGNSNEEIFGSLTLCGKPQPTISWMVGDQTFNGSVVPTNVEPHQYTYSFKKRIEPGMCGKRISYKAKGFGKNMVNGSSLILLESCELQNIFVAILE